MDRKKKKIKERRAAGRCALSSWHPPARPGPAGLSRQKPAGRERERSETQTHPCPGCAPPGFPPPPQAPEPSLGTRDLGSSPIHRTGSGTSRWSHLVLETPRDGAGGPREGREPGGHGGTGGAQRRPSAIPWDLFFFPLDKVVSSGAAGDQLGPFPYGSDCCNLAFSAGFIRLLFKKNNA